MARLFKSVAPTRYNIDLISSSGYVLNYLTEEWPSWVYVHANSFVRPQGKNLEDVAFGIMEMPDGKCVEIVTSCI